MAFVYGRTAKKLSETGKRVKSRMRAKGESSIGQTREQYMTPPTRKAPKPATIRPDMKKMRKR